MYNFRHIIKTVLGGCYAQLQRRTGNVPVSSWLGGGTVGLTVSGITMTDRPLPGTPHACQGCLLIV